MGIKTVLLSAILPPLNYAYASTPKATTDGDVVHIVFSNHLDVGFGGIDPQLGFDNNVINKYFDWHIPTGIRLGKFFNDTNSPDRHVYTMHSYIASLYLSCPEGMDLHCPSLVQQEEFCQAARDGYITWTALPHNAQLEMMDPEALQGAAQLTFDVDSRCGVPQKTVVSQRDVPGLSRAAVPVLACTSCFVPLGIRALSVGVNKGSAAPGVPQNTPFIWRDAATATQLIAFWHPRGYGGHTVFRGHKIQLTPPEDCIKTPRDGAGKRHVLCFSWRGDNSGPYQDPAQVMKVFEAAREAHPGAHVQASTFEAFLDVLEPFAGQLEVFEGEVGDTWIHGVASDPVKVKNYRAIMRMRSQCLWEGACYIQEPSFQNFTRLFLKVPEHTWGIDTKHAPASWDVWANPEFRAARANSALFHTAEASWLRQSEYISWSLEAFQRSPSLPRDARGPSGGPPERPPEAFRDPPHFAAAAAALLESFTTDPATSARRIHPSTLPQLLECPPHSPTHSAAVAAATDAAITAADEGAAAAHTGAGAAAGAGDVSRPDDGLVSRRQLRLQSDRSDGSDVSDGSDLLEVVTSKMDAADAAVASVGIAGEAGDSLAAAKAIEGVVREEGGGRRVAEEQGLACDGSDGVVLDKSGWHVAVNVTTGAITSFRRSWPSRNGTAAASGTDWAAGGAFARLLYRSHSESYVKAWYEGYTPAGPAGYAAWAMYDFGKPGSGVAAEDREAAAEVVSVHKYEGQYEGQVGIAIKYAFTGWPITAAGAPPVVTLLIHTWDGSDAVMMDVLYDEKQPTRLPESFWLGFAPAAGAAEPGGLRVSKIGSLIDPADVVVNGSHSLHAVSDGGVILQSHSHSWEQLQVAPMDAALVAVGPPEPLPALCAPPKPPQEFHFCLFNNLWGTNYVMWTPYGPGVGESIKSRFVVSVRDSRQSGPAHWSLLRDTHFQNVPRHLLM